MISDAIKKSILRAEGSSVAEVFASTEQVAIEMADLANEVALEIFKGFDWRVFTQIHTINGDGVTETFSLPPRYDRMVKASDIDDASNWFWSYTPFHSINEWMRYRNGGFGIVQPGGWIILGREFNFYPAPTGTASFPYIYNSYATAEDGSEKFTFTRDDDNFVLPDRLITLGCIWKWKAQKGLEYSEDLQNYEIALAQEQSRDKGARVIRETRPGRSFNVSTAYPYSLG